MGTTDPYVARFDEASRAFVRETAFDVVGVDPIQVSGLIATPDGRVYFNRGRETGVFTRAADGTWSVEKDTFARFGTTPVSLILRETDSIVWLQLIDLRLVRYDTSRVALPKHGFTRPDAARHDQRQAVALRRCRAGDRGAPTLSRVVHGAAHSTSPRPTSSTNRPPSTSRGSTGLDTDWSAWTHEPRRDYTNLGFGRLPLPGPGAERARPGERRGDLRVRHPAAVVPHVVGVRAATCSPSACSCSRRSPAAPPAGPRRSASASQFAEARLRAEAAEALARSEGEGKKNVELLSEIGREITSSLDIDTIFDRLYDHMNELADAEVFGVGLYHPERQRDRLPAGDREGQALRAVHARHQRPQPAARCGASSTASRSSSTTSTPSTSKYIAAYDEQRRPLEDGTMSARPQSIIYMPLIAKDRVLGIITIQSFEKHAYTEHHLNVMQSLASYTSIAIDNAAAYRQLNEQEHENRRLFEEARRRAPSPRRPTPPRAPSCRPSATSCARRSPRCSASPRSSRSASRTASSRSCQTDDRKVRADDPAGAGQPDGGRQRGRAPHQAHRRRARPRQDRGGQARMAHGAGRRRRHRRARDGGDLVALRAEGADGSSRRSRRGPAGA